MAFTSAKDAVRSFGFKTAQPDRLIILDHVWEKEAGGYAKHWKLTAVRKGVIYVTPSSPAAAMELQLRSPALMRGINKYFKSAWIKAIRTAR